MSRRLLSVRLRLRSRPAAGVLLSGYGWLPGALVPYFYEVCLLCSYS